MSVKIICPYVQENEIGIHKQRLWNLPIYYEKDHAMIGSDRMYQKLWNKFPKDDIFILHADMLPPQDDEDNVWFDSVLEYVEKYPEAGMFGCLLLYPAQEDNEDYFVQCAGGKFTEDGNPDHFGSGLMLENHGTFKEVLETDTGQYNAVRSVAWTTFGGIYIRRKVFDKIGNFDPRYEWTYNRDVDYCMRTREAGFKIYQIPVKLFHHESRDNKIIKAQNEQLVKAEMRNLETLKNLWSDTEFYKTLDEVISNE